MNRLSSSRILALTAVAALLAATGCTVAGPRTARDADGWETTTTYECDWKNDSAFLHPGSVPNSPIMPWTRAYWAKTGLIGVLFAMPVDLVASPIAFLADRNCWVTGTNRNYVGTPESVARARREQEENARKERLAQEESARRNTDAQKKLDAEAAIKRAEADKVAAAKREEDAKIAAMYPPLNESPRPAAARPDDFALIVGIEGYRSIPKADYAEGDAKLVKTYVESLGVPPANVILLTGADASRADIAKYLEEWLPGVVKSDSRVYFYYSGHGAPDPQSGAAYLVPYDGDPKFLKSTTFALSKIYSDLSALPAKESVVMLDSCFSGAGGRSVMTAGVRPLVNVEDTTTAPDKVEILSASGAHEIAGGLDLQKHGLFTYFLLRGLAGEADALHDGHVTLGQLNDYVRAKVREAARRDNRDQNPRMLGDGSLKIY
jgi:hypothetical protein